MDPTLISIMNWTLAWTTLKSRKLNSESFEKVERFRNGHRKLFRVLQIETRWDEVYANTKIGHVLSRPL